MVMKGMKILVVDDEQTYCDVLKMIFTDKGYIVDTCNNGVEAIRMLEANYYDLVVTDLRMPVMDGFELLLEIKKREYDVEVILLTAFGKVETAVEAMKNGAFTYVTKGSDPEELLVEIKKVKELRDLKKKNQVLSEKITTDYMLESRNENYQRVLMLAERAAASDSGILILGESGTGKEVIASYIHNKSLRNTGNFMEVNCQAISESILESELFGHEKGSFTGASQKRIGHFEASNGGTLFLDEIGGVSYGLQGKLLKAIENKKIYRVGSSTPIDVDFRLITATNRNLKEDIDNDLFRGDLFYRISTIVLELPALRERREDIPLFIDYFINKYSKELGIENVEMSDNVRTLLENYDYPGNIRELKNVIERLLVLSDRGKIIEEYLPSEIATGKKVPVIDKLEFDYTQSLRDYRKKAEKAYIEELLRQYPDDMDKVSEILSITRRQLFNKMTEFELK
ncbi:MAG: sigma-54 dependent transcriptional regulator [Firmicutes bacterium]|nr:sigma-54 dependent transcriptional regulator [Bacillota bacterium]